MTFLTREQILQAQDIQRESVSVPEWGGDVLVQSLSGAERDAYEATVMRLNGTDAQINLVNVRAKLVSRSCVDESGVRIFSDDDVKALSKKSAVALQRVFDAASRLSGLSKNDLDELTKNSGDGQRDDLAID